MTDDLIARLRRMNFMEYNGHPEECTEAADALEAKDKRIAFLEALLSDVNTGYAECIATREDYRARIAELEARLNYIEAHVLGLVKTHSQFAAAADGSWSGKKQRVRAAEASQILAFIRKERAAMEGEKK